MSLRPSTKNTDTRHLNVADAEQGRRRREQDLVVIRKIDRDHSLRKKRRHSEYDDTGGGGNVKYMIEAAVAGVYSDVDDDRLDGIVRLNKLLAAKDPPISEVLQSGALPRVVEFLERDSFPQLQYEAAWILTSIAFGESNDFKAVVNLGAVPILVRLLGSQHVYIREQVLWALGNIAAGSTECRELVLSCGAVHALLTQFFADVKPSMIKVATWALSNLCRGKPKPPFQQTKDALPVLHHAVLHSTDDEVLSNTCWALSYISDKSEGSDGSAQAVTKAGFCPRLVELLGHQSNIVVFPALRTVGNIVGDDDDVQTQCVIDCEALPRLLNLMTTPRTKTVTRKACLVISDIAGGTREQLQAVITAGVVGPLVSLLANAAFDIKQAAALAISNATYVASRDQIKFLVHEGCLKPLRNLLKCNDPTVISFCLDALENILKAGEEEKNLGSGGGYDVYTEKVLEAEGVDEIEKLQIHENDEISGKAVEIIETYFVEDDEVAPPEDRSRLHVENTHLQLHQVDFHSD